MTAPEKFIAAFKSKVIMYLYEDAAKSVKRRLFEGCDASSLWPAVFFTAFMTPNDLIRRMKDSASDSLKLKIVLISFLV